MRQAFAPEYATMNRDPTTKSFVERIESPQGNDRSGARAGYPRGLHRLSGGQTDSRVDRANDDADGNGDGVGWHVPVDDHRG